jgi:hypothetical protein
VERLRAAAERSREASSTALASADSMLARGLASESRNAAVVSNMHADRAAEQEASARAEELHEVALSEAQGRLLLDVIGRGYGDLGLPVPRSFIRDLLRGWPGPVDESVVAAARGEIRRPVVAEVRAEIALAEAERATRPALSAGPVEGEGEVVDGEVVGGDAAGPDAEEPGDLPTWAELPEAWKARYQLHPDLGRQEYERALLSEQKQQREGRPQSAGRERFPTFRHPGLG